MYILTAKPICRRLVEHCARRACWRAWFNAGINIAAITAMMTITISSSRRVKPLRTRGFISVLPAQAEKQSAQDAERNERLAAGFRYRAVEREVAEFHICNHAR